MVEAACLYLWDISIDGLDESEFRERICKIIGEPANKWTVTKAEIKEQCKKLRVDPFGDVASRVVSFMERVNNIIDTRGWKSQLKAPNMLKTFIKAELKAKRAVKAMIAEDGREQRWIRLNGVFEVPYCPDTGADQNVLPQRILDEMMTLQPDLMMVTLKEPIIGMACNNLPFQANSYVDLALQLQTAAGPVKIPGKRRCYVVAKATSS
ncbi:hypothetical protein DYB26_002976 [Aphanomyces astaci]|uniref:Uncharacterized protein n=1 Tax=Aphanomyces astaci TaxID=112090 RepID=A0A3R6W977_APHAT|nr:hypothetical protein DYB26_002976 [Aphanomyces astaci]